MKSKVGDLAIGDGFSIGGTRGVVVGRTRSGGVAVISRTFFDHPRRNVYPESIMVERLDGNPLARLGNKWGRNLELQLPLFRENGRGD